MSPFRGGVSSTSNLCGAVTGAIAAIGLNFGHSNNDDIEIKQRCSKATQEFITKFVNLLGSIKCTPLLGHNLISPGEREKATEEGAFRSRCPKYVETATKIAQNIINECK